MKSRAMARSAWRASYLSINTDNVAGAKWCWAKQKPNKRMQRYAHRQLNKGGGK